MTHPFDDPSAYRDYRGPDVGDSYNSTGANNVDPNIFMQPDDYYAARLAAQQAELAQQQNYLYGPQRAALAGPQPASAPAPAQRPTGSPSMYVPQEPTPEAYPTSTTWPDRTADRLDAILPNMALIVVALVVAAVIAGFVWLLVS